MILSFKTRVEIALTLEFIIGMVTVYVGKLDPLYAFISIVIGGIASAFLICDIDTYKQV